MIVFVMTGAIVVFGACVVVMTGDGSRFQNLVNNHQSMPRAVKPAPEKTHCLFCTITTPTLRLLYSNRECGMGTVEQGRWYLRKSSGGGYALPACRGCRNCFRTRPR